MSVRIHRSEKSRHLVLRISAGETLPEALTEMLRDERVACGWLRGGGVIEDVEIRALDPEIGALGSSRRIAGRVHLIASEGSIGLAQGQPTFSLRALLARETDRGLEALAGEIIGARAVGVEVIVTALDDVVLERALDPSAGVWLIGTPSPSPVTPADPRPRAGWSAALEASAEGQREPPAPPRPPSAAGAPQPGPTALMPRRRTLPEPDVDAPAPEAGDVVDHFAFGRCDVLKSDGDRLHLRVHKDGRVREIALEMLRVTRSEDVGGVQGRFKLERRI